MASERVESHSGVKKPRPDYGASKVSVARLNCVWPGCCGSTLCIPAGILMFLAIPKSWPALRFRAIVVNCAAGTGTGHAAHLLGVPSSDLIVVSIYDSSIITLVQLTPVKGVFPSVNSMKRIPYTETNRMLPHCASLTILCQLGLAYASFARRLYRRSSLN